MKAIYSIVGMKHRGTEALVASMRAGEKLLLVRDPNNRFDSNAIEVWGRDKPLGYVKGTEAASLARAMDAKQITTKEAVFKIEGRWPGAEVDE